MRKHKISLLCLDIDGTLLDSQHRLPTENRAAIQRADQAGVTICLMSARPPKAITPIMEELGVCGIVVSFSGGLITVKNTVLCDYRIPQNSAQHILDMAEKSRISLSVYRDTEWYVAEHDAWNAQESSITKLSMTVADLHALLDNWEYGAHKLLCMGEPAQIRKIETAIKQQQLAVQISRSKGTYLEILPEGVGKGMALHKLCSELGISAEQTMAIGDHDNDCDMFEQTAYSVAMGNGSKAAKQKAKLQTIDNDHAGVAYAIRKWIFEDLD